MGCDIHCWAEVRDENGKWNVVTDKVFPNMYHDNKELNNPNISDGMKEWFGPTTDRPVHWRQYDLFSVLANVRNGYGFAGVPTGTGFVPISMPKGVPDDCSPFFRDEVKDWGMDGHSHSWLTVAELEAADWVQGATGKTGVLNGMDMLQWLRNGGPLPPCYAGSISGRDIVEVPFEELTVKCLSMLDRYRDGKLSEVETRALWNTVARFSTPVAYSELFAFFVEDTLPALRKLGNPDDVRIVFFFDN